MLSLCSKYLLLCIKHILSIVPRILLFTLGWKSLGHRVREQLTSQKRCILVFSHSAYVDFFFFLLYLLSNPQDEFTIRLLMKPQPFAYLDRPLRWLGAIPSTKLQITYGGACARIIKELDSHEKFLFFLCPKGTIVPRPWRTGYFYLAQQLQASILVLGLDYELKSLVITSPTMKAAYWTE